MRVVIAASVLGLVLVRGAVAEDINRHLYPSAATMVAVMDLKNLRDSRLFDDEFDRSVDALLQNNEQVRRLCELMQFDLKRDVHSMTICGVGEGRNGSALMIVNGDFPYDKLAASLEEMAHKGELTSLKINDLPVYFNHRARQAIYFALVDSRTAVASSSKPNIEDAIQGLTELREPKGDLRDRLAWNEAGDKPSIALAGVFPESARRQMSRVPQMAGFANDLVGYNINVYFGDTSEIEGRLTLKSAEAAQQAAAALKLLLELGKAALQGQPDRQDALTLMNSLKLESKERSLHVEAALSRETLQSMLAAGRRDRQRIREQRQNAEAARKAAERKVP